MPEQIQKNSPLQKIMLRLSDARANLFRKSPELRKFSIDEPMSSRIVHPQFLRSISLLTLSSFLSSQIIFLPGIIQRTVKEKLGWKKFALLIWHKTAYLSFYGFVSFGWKLYFDLLFEEPYYHHEAISGALAGIFTFFVTRPFDQIRKTQFISFSNHKTYISLEQACRLITAQSGFRGFYKHENFSGPLSYGLYRALLFRSYEKYHDKEKSSSKLAEFILKPFLSCFTASLFTLPFEKIRRYRLNQLLMQEHTVLNPRNKVEKHSSMLKKALKSIETILFSFEKAQFRNLAVSIGTASIMFSMFLLGQSYSKSELGPFGDSGNDQ